MALAMLAPAVLDAIRKHGRRLVFLAALGIRNDRDRQPDPIDALDPDIEHVIERSGLEGTLCLARFILLRRSSV